jgi:hypothetical protein
MIFLIFVAGVVILCIRVPFWFDCIKRAREAGRCPRCGAINQHGRWCWYCGEPR